MSSSYGLVRVPNPFMGMLVSTKVKDIRPARPVLYLRSYDTMKDVMDALNMHTVLSFPVLDENDECLGIIDGVDLVSFLRQCPTGQSHSEALNKTIESYINASQSNPYIPVFSTTTLYAVITILAPGCHRTVVFTDEEYYSLHSMFSETDLINFLHYYIKHDRENKPLQRVANLPICAFSGSRSRPTHTAFTDEPLHSAFAHVLSFRRGETASATVSNKEGETFDYATPLVAVFDRETGALVGHVDATALGQTACRGSEKDKEQIKEKEKDKKKGNKKEEQKDNEKGVGAGNIKEEESLVNVLSPMDMTIGDFLTTFTPESMATWVVPEDISLRELLRVLVRNKLHHVWVANRGVEPQPLTEIGKKLRVPCERAHKETCEEDHPMDNCERHDHECDQAMQNEELFGKGVLGVVTLNDVLRWVARDNLWLKEDQLPLE